MLSRRHRLSRVEIESIKKRGKRLNAPLLSIFYVARDDNDASRFICVVSRRVSSKAVGRNKIKRRCREAVAGALPRLQKPADLVVILKKESAEASHSDMQSELSGLFGNV